MSTGERVAIGPVGGAPPGAMIRCMRPPAVRSTAGVLVAVALCGCGGGAGPGHPAAAAPVSDGVAASVAVIRAWSRALARGDVAAASAYFATPSQVQITPDAPVVTVTTAAEARTVNRSLTCGARLLASRPVDRYIDALFRLGPRPGADCGAGVGATARVAFVISGGRIAVWRRIPAEPGDAAHAAPGPSSPAAQPPTPTVV
jgi:hypothetical protein